MAAATSTSELSTAMVWRFDVFAGVVKVVLGLMLSLEWLVAGLAGDTEFRKDAGPVRLRGESFEYEPRTSSA
jgi:hypothetical protein